MSRTVTNRIGKSSWHSFALGLAVALCVPGVAQVNAQTDAWFVNLSRSLPLANLASSNVPASESSVSKSAIGLFSLPPDAQGPISAALGKDDSGYWGHLKRRRGFRGENPQQASGTSSGYSETVIHSFTGTDLVPESGGIIDSAGNFYGITYGGGTAGLGTVFKLASNGRRTVLYNFKGAARADGANPNPGLVMDSAGNLYGTTLQGGTVLCAYSIYDLGCGTVFKLDLSTGKETVLYRFTAASGDGWYSNGGLVLDSTGNMYGTTSRGGAANYGTVFKLDPTGKETVLYSFGGTSGDGAEPKGGLVLFGAGSLYGTTEYGGITASPCNSFGCGTVFKLDLTTGKETVLYSFTGTGGDGANPVAGVVLDSAGNMYGTTDYGGSNGSGTALKLDPTGKEMWVYSFGSTSGDGANPVAGVVLDSAGNLYGTTELGGANNAGTVFKLDPSGNEKWRYGFTGANGEYPASALIIDSVGNLYGFTTRSQVYAPYYIPGGGEFFKLDPSGHEITLYTFPDTNGDGADSYAGLVLDSSGNLYGTTGYGGSNDLGTVFKLDPTGKETVLHSFGSPSGDGARPQGGLIFDSAGNVYGTTGGGGDSSSCVDSYSCGTVFKVDPTGKETVLYSFGSTSGDGMFPIAGVVLDSAGNLYGTTYAGGNTGGTCVSAYGCGTVFKLDLTTGTETVLYSFTGMSGDGGNPVSSVVLDGAGHLYGTTLFGGMTADSCDVSSCGTVFKLDLTTGKETVLHNFTGTNGDGANPSAGVVLDSAGNIYGTTEYGGSTNCLSFGCGTVFKLDPSGNEIWVYNFTATSGDGAGPYGGLVLGAGDLYGTTQYGGSNGMGTVFKVDSSGKEIVLYSFGGARGDGANPYGSLLLDSAGNLYGTTSYAGSALGGTVFKLKVAPATLTPASATYPAQKVGTTSAAKTFTLTNNQIVALTSIAISTTGDFAVSATTCGTSLAAKSKCTVSVTFTPTRTGTRTGQLRVSDSANNSPQTSNLKGTGK